MGASGIPRGRKLQGSEVKKKEKCTYRTPGINPEVRSHEWLESHTLYPP